MKLKVGIAAVLLLTITATAGDQLPAGNPINQWNGTNSQGDTRVEVKTSTGNAVTFTRIKTLPDGTKITSAMNCAWDSSDQKYHTPQGGTIEFDDVVNGNSSAYNYTYTGAGGGTETGLVSNQLP